MQPIAVVEGIVGQGKKLGRTMGVPTANLPLPEEGKRPENGIYVAEVVFPDEGGRREEGVLSQGFHPTLPEGDPTIEVYLLNRSETLYGRRIRIEYLQYIRPEMKFDSREALRQMMQRDIVIARGWFARRRAGKAPLRALAGGYYRQGYNCAEALLRAINEDRALRLSEDALRLAAGFGGGMGCGDACGAMTGAVAGLGALLVKGRAHQTPGFSELCAGWVEQFRRDLGSSLCAELKPKYKTAETGCLETVLRAADSFENYLLAREAQGAQPRGEGI